MWVEEHTCKGLKAPPTKKITKLWNVPMNREIYIYKIKNNFQIEKLILNFRKFSNTLNQLPFSQQPSSTLSIFDFKKSNSNSYITHLRLIKVFTNVLRTLRSIRTANIWVSLAWKHCSYDLPNPSHW